MPGTVALTFDDGPSEYTATVLSLLDKYDAKGTFFICGANNIKGQIDRVDEWGEVLQRMLDGGHQLASHTWSHYDLSKI